MRFLKPLLAAGLLACAATAFADTYDSTVPPAAGNSAAVPPANSSVADCNALTSDARMQCLQSNSVRQTDPSLRGPRFGSGG